MGESLPTMFQALNIKNKVWPKGKTFTEVRSINYQKDVRVN